MKLKINVNPKIRGLYMDHYDRLCFIVDVAGYSAMFYIYIEEFSRYKYDLWATPLEYDKLYDKNGLYDEDIPHPFCCRVGMYFDSIIEIKKAACSWMAAVINKDYDTITELYGTDVKFITTDIFDRNFDFVPPRQWERYVKINKETRKIRKKMMEELNITSSLSIPNLSEEDRFEIEKSLN